MQVSVVRATRTRALVCEQTGLGKQSIYTTARTGPPRVRWLSSVDDRDQLTGRGGNVPIAANITEVDNSGGNPPQQQNRKASTRPPPLTKLSNLRNVWAKRSPMSAPKESASAEAKTSAGSMSVRVGGCCCSLHTPCRIRSHTECASSRPAGVYCDLMDTIQRHCQQPGETSSGQEHTRTHTAPRTTTRAHGLPVTAARALATATAAGANNTTDRRYSP